MIDLLLSSSKKPLSAPRLLLTMSLISDVVAQWQCNFSLPAPPLYILLATVAAVVLVGGTLVAVFYSSRVPTRTSALVTYSRFIYASFLKPHTGDETVTCQQAALESFYKTQVCRTITLSYSLHSRAMRRKAL